MDSYACDFAGTRPYHLIRDNNIECFSPEHMFLMGCGLVGLIIYYPISTFMSPNF